MAFRQPNTFSGGSEKNQVSFRKCCKNSEEEKEELGEGTRKEKQKFSAFRENGQA